MKFRQKTPGWGVWRVAGCDQAAAVHREGKGAIVHQEVPVALEVGEAKAVRGSAESEQFRRGGGHHRLMVVEICRREDVRRVQREAVAHPLCDTRHSGQDGESRVRQAFGHATQRTGRRKPRATGLRTRDTADRTAEASCDRPSYASAGSRPTPAGSASSWATAASSFSGKTPQARKLTCCMARSPLVFRAMPMMASRMERGQREPSGTRAPGAIESGKPWTRRQKCAGVMGTSTDGSAPRATTAAGAPGAAPAGGAV